MSENTQETNKGQHAQDEDTAVSEAIIECAWVIRSAAKAVEAYRQNAPFMQNNVAYTEKVLTKAINAEKCGAYIKGLDYALGVDASEEYLNHLLDVVDSIHRSRLNGFKLKPLACISPNDIRGYGGVKDAGFCGIPAALDGMDLTWNSDLTGAGSCGMPQADEPARPDPECDCDVPRGDMCVTAEGSAWGGNNMVSAPATPAKDAKPKGSTLTTTQAAVKAYKNGGTSANANGNGGDDAYSRIAKTAIHRAAVEDALKRTKTYRDKFGRKVLTEEERNGATTYKDKFGRKVASAH